MSSLNPVQRVLQHHGVKGMKWGVRKGDTAGGFGLSAKEQRRMAKTSPTAVTVTQKKSGGKVKTSGGKRQPLADDAVKARTLQQKARASTTHSLSNQELQDLVKRMNLEQQFANLDNQQKVAGRSFVRKLLTGNLKRGATSVSNAQTDEAASAVNRAIKTRVAATAAKRAATAAL